MHFTEVHLRGIRFITERLNWFAIELNLPPNLLYRSGQQPRLLSAKQSEDEEPHLNEVLNQQRYPKQSLSSQVCQIWPTWRGKEGVRAMLMESIQMNCLKLPVVGFGLFGSNMVSASSLIQLATCPLECWDWVISMISRSCILTVACVWGEMRAHKESFPDPSALLNSTQHKSRTCMVSNIQSKKKHKYSMEYIQLQSTRSNIINHYNNKSSSKWTGDSDTCQVTTNTSPSICNELT